MTTIHEAVAPHVAERIARAQDMLGRLGQRETYEPNYATEKLADAARCALEACALLDMRLADVDDLANRAWDRGGHLRSRLASEGTTS